MKACYDFFLFLKFYLFVFGSQNQPSKSYDVALHS